MFLKPFRRLSSSNSYECKLQTFQLWKWPARTNVPQYCYPSTKFLISEVAQKPRHSHQWQTQVVPSPRGRGDGSTHPLPAEQHWASHTGRCLPWQHCANISRWLSIEILVCTALAGSDGVLASWTPQTCQECCSKMAEKPYSFFMSTTDIHYTNTVTDTAIHCSTT